MLLNTQYICLRIRIVYLQSNSELISYNCQIQGTFSILFRMQSDASYHDVVVLHRIDIKSK